MPRIEYVIIQAGGKGTRLGQLTRNKPKGIVPVNNLPIIFHLFRQYKDKKYIIIGDYLHEVLERYLEAFDEADCITVKAEGTGTCAGIKKALEFIPDDEPFLIIWSDLILDDELKFDELEEGNYIGLSQDFECRWSFISGECAEIPSRDKGIAGFFIIKSKELVREVPESGELVRWLGASGIKFVPLSLQHTKEIGTLIAYDENKKNGYVCRPFNRMEQKGEALIKTPIDKQGEMLAVREIAWYEKAKSYGFTAIPKIYEYSPLTMQRINGENIYKAKLSSEEKKLVIKKLVEELNTLHGYKKVKADAFSIMDAYYGKTFKRLDQVRDLIPFADKDTIVINGVECKNPYFYRDEIRERVKEIAAGTKELCFIHGDCTFSNTMVTNDKGVIFIDPRGYFGNTELYGDSYYDWAKLYYSISGNYDRFNNKEFELDIKENEVCLSIESNGFEEFEDFFLSEIKGCDKEKLRFIHAIIWLSLTTYAWEDYDSICGAFYNGAYLMNEFL